MLTLFVSYWRIIHSPGEEKKVVNTFFIPLKGLNLFVFSNKQLQLNI